MAFGGARAAMMDSSHFIDLQVAYHQHQGAARLRPLRRPGESLRL